MTAKFFWAMVVAILIGSVGGRLTGNLVALWGLP
jgi:hypothetical protein